MAMIERRAQPDSRARSMLFSKACLRADPISEGVWRCIQGLGIRGRGAVGVDSKEGMSHRATRAPTGGLGASADQVACRSDRTLGFGALLSRSDTSRQPGVHLDWRRVRPLAGLCPRSGPKESARAAVDDLPEPAPERTLIDQGF